EQRAEDTGHDSLFGDMADSHTITKIHLEKSPSRLNDMNPLQWEKELLGLYISGHPLAQFEERLKKSGTNIAGLKTMKNKSEIMLGGIIEEIKEILTKNSDKMVFMRLADMTGTIETVIFPKVYDQFKDILAVENCVVVKGTISTRNEEKSILVDKIKMLE